MKKIMSFDVSKAAVQTLSFVSDKEPKISAIAMGKDSREFLDAAKILAGDRDASQMLINHLLPLYYLLCHAMELSLKAFLRAKGYDDDALKSVGHSLRRCAKRARAEGLAITQDFEEMVEWLDHYHSDNAFRYQRERHLKLPLPHEVIARIEPQIEASFSEVSSLVLRYLRERKAPVAVQHSK